jgi:hypothetical protein
MLAWMPAGRLVETAEFVRTGSLESAPMPLPLREAGSYRHTDPDYLCREFSSDLRGKVAGNLAGAKYGPNPTD